MIATRSDIREKLLTVRELSTFFWQGKTWWLTPVVLALILLSALIIFTETSALAPFIYTMF